VIGFDASAYPNPFSKECYLNITSAGARSVGFQVIDIMGRKVLSKTLKIQQGTQVIAVDEAINLTPGIYLLKISGSDFKRTISLVKQ
jgi:hypothetical protein